MKTAPEPMASIEVFSPEKATEILAKPSENVRNINEDYVRALARTMVAGRWDLNGETIKFNRAGALVDGQHRLAACVLANKPLRTYVVRGIGSDLNVDVGRHRTAAQLLAREGVRRPVLASGALRIVCCWEDGLRDRRLVTRASSVPNSAVQSAFERHAKIVDSVESVFLAGIANTYPATLAFVHFMGAQAFGSERADLFLSGVSGGADPGDPRQALRDRIQGQFRGKLDRWHFLLISVRAWNAFARGETLKKLQSERSVINPDGELVEPKCPDFAEPRKAVAAR